MRWYQYREIIRFACLRNSSVIVFGMSLNRKLGYALPEVPAEKKRNESTQQRCEQVIDRRKRRKQYSVNRVTNKSSGYFMSIEQRKNIKYSELNLGYTLH